MHPSHHELTQNKLLALLSKPDLDVLQPHFELTDLSLHDVLHTAHDKVEHAYFPISGICSVIAENAQGIHIETGLIGREGFVGIPIIHYADSAPLKVIVQADGRALKMSRAALLHALETNRTFSANLLRFAHVFSVQVSQTALANGHFTLNQRLARWLLMCHDRVELNEFPMTHRFLATMLAVRRAGITEALNFLEGENAIKALRGRIAILNRKKIEEIAHSAYGVPEREYQRLLPPL